MWISPQLKITSYSFCDLTSNWLCCHSYLVTVGIHVLCNISTLGKFFAPLGRKSWRWMFQGGCLSKVTVKEYSFAFSFLFVEASKTSTLNRPCVVLKHDPDWYWLDSLTWRRPFKITSHYLEIKLLLVLWKIRSNF